MAASRFIFDQIVAEFAKDHDIIGQQDPYVLFELDGVRALTSVAKKAGTTPAWNEEVVLEAPSGGDQTLTIIVYNKNTLLPDSNIGHATIPVSQMSGTQRVTLMDKKGTKQTGILSFHVRDGGGQQGMGQQGMGQQGMETSQEGYTGMGAAGAGYATGGATTGGTGEPCDRQTFSQVEDRPVVHERKEYVLEHNPVEKEFVVETKLAGEHAVGGGETEHLGTEVNIVSEAPPTSPCEGAQDIGAQRVAGSTGTTGGSGQY
jgi:hypothetical protein